MTETTNTKAGAWDLVGSLFWTQGRKSARPTRREVELFLQGVGAGVRVCVIGASTKELVETAVDLGARVQVFDFSSRMCLDLRSALANAAVSIDVQDITTPVPPDLAGRFDLVLSDRLLNRFDGNEARRALSGMAALAAPGGEVRASVKLGLYPMDERMIDEGRRNGTLATFFNEGTRTIDYPAAGPLLDELVLPHGDIPREVLLGWYRGRGREKRFSETDLAELAGELRAAGAVESTESQPFPDAPNTVLWTLRRTAQAN